MKKSNESVFCTLEAEQVCSRTGISRATLYAYVSRGIVRAIAHPEDSRKSLYDRRDVQSLLDRQSRGRSRQSVAESTIHWGEPILVSRITRIADGQFYYRGRNAVELADVMTLEDVAYCLARIRVTPAKCASTDVIPPDHQLPFHRMVFTITEQVTAQQNIGDGRVAAAKLLRLAALAAAGIGDDGQSAIHQMLAQGWSGSSKAPELLRRALVLCADHELNASTYTVRVAASAGAVLPACLLAGLSTLSGSLHGGLTPKCRAWMDQVENEGMDPLQDGLPPGFGHPLYPERDPRAKAIIQACGIAGKKSYWTKIACNIYQQTGVHPSLDFGLALLERQLDLPVGAGLGIFALGRMVGWIAHVFEQRETGKLIRPRAIAP